MHAMLLVLNKSIIAGFPIITPFFYIVYFVSCNVMFGQKLDGVNKYSCYITHGRSVMSGKPLMVFLPIFNLFEVKNWDAWIADVHSIYM